MRLLGPIFFTGLLILQAQVLFFREFLVLFHGNELALGGMLMVWLVGTGLGSLAGGRLFRTGPGKKFYGFLPISLAILLPGSIGILRWTPSWLGYSWGEMISLSGGALITIITLFPFCFISGILFPFFGNLAKRSSSSLQSIRFVYWVEALGAAAGGSLGLFLITWVDGIELALWIGSGLAVCSFWILGVHPERKIKGRNAFIALIPALIFLILALGFGKTLNQVSRAVQWRPFVLKKVRETPLGSVALAEKAGQLNFFMNGVFQFSSPDPRRAEEKTHLPLLIHPYPKTILVIGGGLSGTLREILKHPTIQRIDYVEMDRLWVKEVGHFLPEITPFLWSNPKVHLLFGDGRHILRKSLRKYDLILLDLPGPATLQLNRFYSREFFQIARNHLMPKGLLTLILGGTADMIGISQSQTLKCLYSTLQKTFPTTGIFPGEEIYLLGFRDETDPGILPEVIIRRLKDRAVNLQYLNAMHLETTLSPWRRNYFETVLNQGFPEKANQDLRPEGFFNQTLFELAHQHPRPAAFFQEIKAIPMVVWMGIFLILLFSFLVWIRLFSRFRPGLPVLTAIGITGFSGMALEMIILFLFQIAMGYLYLEIGLLIAFFMLGMAGGALVVFYIEEGLPPARLSIGSLQVLFSVFFLMLLGTGKWMGGIPEGILKTIFYGFMIFSGGLCGAVYCLCSRTYFALGKGIGRTAGHVYGLDLLGASLACMTIPFFLLPVWGLAWTLFFLFLINFSSAILIGSCFLTKGEPIS